MESAHEIHSRYLEKLLRNLNMIDIEPKNVSSVIQEPKWYHDGTRQERSLCDAFILFEDSVMPIELKYSVASEAKARSQIKQGFDYCVSEIKKPFLMPGRIVFYDEPFH
ncbi:MAG: hypothetical protein ACOCP8_04390, partial [archaeon]